MSFEPVPTSLPCGADPADLGEAQLPAANPVADRAIRDPERRGTEVEVWTEGVTV